MADSEHFISASFDKAIYLWNLDGVEKYRWVFPSRIQDIGISHDYTKMLVVNCEKTIKVVDLQSKQGIGSPTKIEILKWLKKSQMVKKKCQISIFFDFFMV